MYYSIIAIFTVFLSIALTLLVKKFALKYQILDTPDIDRKIHKKPIPLLGGIAIFLAFFIILFFVKDKILIGDLEINHWIGVFVGACFLMIGGFLDDKFNVKPYWQLVFPILACISVILGGVEVAKINNPFQIDSSDFLYFSAIISHIFIFGWLMGMMYTTKLLDGIDGLVTGVTMIGAIIIFLFTMTTKYYQPDIALGSLILASSCLGFLVLNWHPAKIFLGEGGSLFLGYILGVLAIISGGKVAIAILVMGAPIIDMIWTILRRLAKGKNPMSFADREHLHFRLLDLGLSAQKTVLIFYAFASIFGTSALFLQSTGKTLAISVLCVIMVIVVWFSKIKTNIKKTDK